MNPLKLNILLFFLLFSGKVFSAHPIILKEKDGKYFARGRYIDVFFDSSNVYSIEDVSSPSFSGRFSKNHQDVPRILTRYDAAYWIRFYVRNDCKEQVTWVIELYDFEIDKFEIYVPVENGNFKVFRGGDIYPFSNKEFYHKNFVFEIPAPARTVQPYYIKFQSESPMGVMALIRSIQAFTGYATTEYYFLAIFYGIALAMIGYNLFLFFTVRDRAYLYFVLYVTSIAVFNLCHDGTGFEYLWPDQPWLNKYVQPTANMFSMVWALMYSKSFLSLRQISPLLNRVLTFAILFRVAIYLLTVFIIPEISVTLYFDILTFILAYTAGIISLKRGFTPARFYLLAFTFLLLGFTVTSFETLGIISSNVVVVYSLHFGLVSEMLLLSLALGDRIKVLMKEKEIAQRDMIFQLQEKEVLKDKVNKELEQKVYERTIELESKNKELDTFVYKASHDIKGPLKSLIGLTMVGMRDVKDPVALTYFEHILKSTRRLDTLLTDLLRLTQVKQIIPESERIDFREIVDEVLASFEHFPRYSDLDFRIDIKAKGDFFSDRKLVYPVIQNLIENPIKYCREDDVQPYLHIKITADEEQATLVFTDNGIGISKDEQAKIFEMFYKVNESSSGNGLGLHIVKLSIEKLRGTLQVESEPGVGSVFTVKLNALKKAQEGTDNEAEVA